MDILKNITDQLGGKVSEANFEGANIVVYTKDENFFREGESKIKSIVEQIKNILLDKAPRRLLLLSCKSTCVHTRIFLWPCIRLGRSIVMNYVQNLASCVEGNSP